MLNEGRKHQAHPQAAPPSSSWKEFLRRGDYTRIYQGQTRHADDTGGDPLLRRHHRHHQGHPAYQPELQRPGHRRSSPPTPSSDPADKMLAVMPMFHGFGLGVSIHYHAGGAAAAASWCPASPPRVYADLLRKYQPNLIAGVPTLLRGAAAADQKMDGRGPELPQGCVLRRRLPRLWS